MDEFEIVCNWSSDDHRELNCLIAHSTEMKKGIEGVTAETCICLIPKNNENDNPPQKPELKIKSKHLLKELNIYSEANLVEVFGVYNEYLCTCKAEFIDDWEGLAVYHTNVELPGITTCTLKFTRTREKDRLWLYSIQPTTAKLDLSNQTLFNVQNIINLLSSSVQKSKKTEEVRKIVKSQLNSLSSPPFKFPSVLNVKNREYNFQPQDLFKYMNKSGFSPPSENPIQYDISKNKLENEYVINYIDKKFTEMKVELMNQMETKLAQLRNEYDAKLEKIMKLIENVKI